jgi:predicted ABC-type ATPase
VIPQLWIVAGPNGSGKTTLVQKYFHRFTQQIPVVNPDTIATKIKSEDPGLVALRAGREALRQQNLYLNSSTSFLLETTFSGKREIKLLQQAKVNGFKTNLIFVGLPSSIRNIQRVFRRVLDGGHDVPVVDIERRYSRSMKNLSNALTLVDRAFIFDNANKKHRLIAVFENGKIIRQADNQPKWFSLVKLSI